jgi:hypothetical protein
MSFIGFFPLAQHSTQGHILHFIDFIVKFLRASNLESFLGLYWYFLFCFFLPWHFEEFRPMTLDYGLFSFFLKLNQIMIFFLQEKAWKWYSFFLRLYQLANMLVCFNVDDVSFDLLDKMAFIRFPTERGHLPGEKSEPCR